MDSQLSPADQVRAKFRAAAKAWAANRPGLELTGVLGRVVWTRFEADPATHGYRAASIHRYVVKHAKRTDTWSLRAIVGEIDTFNLSRRPLFFVAPHKDKTGQLRAWTWRILEHDLQGTTLTARIALRSRS